ncbi:MAG: LEM-3-like GIY-YIG domain-containing protein [Planctomycetota bacterium]|jgi:hypothetical protein
MLSFSRRVREKLKHYVYLYVDPRSGRPFYVGKGKGNRCFAHLKESDSKTNKLIKDLNKLKLTPRIEILKHGLTEQQALLVESTAIDLLGVENLTNEVRGSGSRHGGRADFREIAALLDAKRVTIVEPAILILIHRSYRYGMSTMDLYDVTRSAWKIAPRPRNPELALSVYRGVVREVFQIEEWVKGGSTMRGIDKTGHPVKRPGRWEFVGRVASKPTRAKYIDKSVARYFKKGAQNPVQYVNC